MDKIYIKELWQALCREFLRFRYLCLFVFIFVMLLVLSVGFIWPTTYETSATLFADKSNIIEPLLKDVTKVARSEQAGNLIYTRSILLEAAKKVDLVDESSTPDQQELVLIALRKKLKVKQERDSDLIQVSYTAKTADESFDTLNAVVSAFMEHSVRKKRDASLSAYNFLGAQVLTYKKQLEVAEDKLKQFNTQNKDGTEQGVLARISTVRAEVEALKISIEESQARLNLVKQQLGAEGQNLQLKSRLDELKTRRQTMVSYLTQLQLSYKDTYPDVVSLKAQLKELDDAIKKVGVSTEAASGADKSQNPLFEELRKQQSAIELELFSQTRRLASLNDVLTEESARAERVAAKQAEYSDLTRDYDVTKKVYEEMLEKKESAKLSMTIDIEGQGVTYRIQEPATFPLKPIGLHFIHFVLVGPILGVLAPIALLIAYVFVDPHIRSSRVLQRQINPDIALLGAVATYATPITRRLIAKDVVFLVVIAFIAVSIYCGVAFYWHSFSD